MDHGSRRETSVWMLVVLSLAALAASCTPTERRSFKGRAIDHGQHAAAATTG